MQQMTELTHCPIAETAIYTPLLLFLCSCHPFCTCTVFSAICHFERSRYYMPLTQEKYDDFHQKIL